MQTEPLFTESDICFLLKNTLLMKMQYVKYSDVNTL